MAPSSDQLPLDVNYAKLADWLVRYAFSYFASTHLFACTALCRSLEFCVADGFFYFVDCSPETAKGLASQAADHK